MNSTKKTELINLIKLYIRNWKLFILSFLICIGFSALYIFIKKPVFKISANILVKEDSKGGMGGMAASMMRGLSFGNMLGVGGGAVDDELEIVKSYSILYNAVKDLGLNIVYNKKGLIQKEQYYKNSPVCLQSDIVNMADTFLYYTKFEVKIDKNEQVKVKAIYKRKEIGETTSTFPVKIPTTFGDFTLDKTPFFKSGKNLSMEIMFSGYGGVTEGLMREVSIVAASKKSNVINLAIEDILTKRGKDILNSIIKYYNKYGIDEKNAETNRAVEFLQKRIDLMESDLKSIERAVEKYKTDHQLTDIGTEAKIILEKSSDFKEKLIGAETQYSVIAMIEDFLKAPENRYAVVPMSLGIEEKSAVESLLKYNELLLERLKLLRSTNPGNPAIESMNEQVDVTRQSVLITIQSIKRGIEYARDDLRAQEQIFMKRIKGMPLQEREYIEIKRQQEIKQALFVYLLQQQEENALKLAVSNPKAQIIDNAFAYNKPVAPQKLLIAIAAIFFTVLLPVLFLYFRKMFANKFNTVSELQSISDLRITNTIHSANKQILFEENDSSSVAEEDIRYLRSNMYKMFDNSISQKTLLISSMQREEGKTFIALNLAISMAKTNHKVLFVDADLRNSELSSLLGIKNTEGLYQVLNNNISLEKVIQNSLLDENLYILPTGTVKNNPSESLLSANFKALCDKLKEQYDFIIFDSTALTCYSDAMPIIELADGVIFVARVACTENSSINYIESLIEDMNMKQVMCIINDVEE
ncbi:tyrosine-protein kinase family protein [Bacteroides sp.]|uniref:GumC family protein n=1 Tax=Bacteroides sp. TaxID=29523 RepID=UPI0025BBA325|nr:tyrosine-protein kinase family protein [Bacteroides sp.]